MTRAPDVAGEVIAFRTWRYNADWCPTARLLSLNDGTVWPTDAWLVAECDRHHPAPLEECTCGIYAARTKEHLFDLRYPGHERIVGEVGLVGKVIPGTQGWRAERARPLRLWVPYMDWRLAHALADAYGIPVGLDNSVTV